MTDEELMRLVGPPPVSDELEGNPARRESSEGTSLTDEQMQALLSSTTPAKQQARDMADAITNVGTSTPPSGYEDTLGQIGSEALIMRALGMARGEIAPETIGESQDREEAARPKKYPDRLGPPGRGLPDIDQVLGQKTRDDMQRVLSTPTPDQGTLGGVAATAGQVVDSTKVANDLAAKNLADFDFSKWSVPKDVPSDLRALPKAPPGAFVDRNGNVTFVTGDRDRDTRLNAWSQRTNPKGGLRPLIKGDPTPAPSRAEPSIPPPVSDELAGPPGYWPQEVPDAVSGAGPVVPRGDGSVGSESPGAMVPVPDAVSGVMPVDMGTPVSPGISGTRPGEEPVPDDVPILPTDTPQQKVNKEQINAQLSEERQARALRGIGDQKQLELDRVMQVRQQAVQEQAARQAQFQQAVQRNAAARDRQIADLRAHIVDPRRLMNQMSAWDVANIGALAALNAGAGGEAAANYLTNAVNADTAYQQSRYTNDQQVLSYLVGQQGEERADQQTRAFAAKEALADALELEASRMDAGTVKQNTVLAVEKMRADLRKEKDSLAIHEESMLVQQARANKLGGAGGGGMGAQALDAYRSKWGINDKNQKRIFVLDSADLSTPPIVSPTEPTEEFRNRFDTTQNGFANAYRILDRVQYSMSRHKSAEDLSKFLQTEEGARISADIAQAAPFLATTEGARVNKATLDIFKDMAVKTPGELAAYLNQPANLAHLREAMHNIQDTHDQHLASFAHTGVSQLRKTYGGKLQLRGLGDDDRAEIDGAGKAPPPTPTSTDPKVIGDAIKQAGESAPAQAEERDRVKKNRARIDEWKKRIGEESPSFGLKSPEPVAYAGPNTGDAAKEYARLAESVRAYRASEGRFMGDTDPYNEVPLLDSNRALVAKYLASFLVQRPELADRYLPKGTFDAPISTMRLTLGDAMTSTIVERTLDKLGSQWQSTLVGNIIRNGGN